MRCYLVTWRTPRLYLFQKLDKDAKLEVDQAVEEAKASPEPLPTDLWADIYYKGSEPPFMRGERGGRYVSFFSSACQ